MRTGNKLTGKTGNSVNSQTIRNYGGLDICKLIMAIFVVAIHSGPFEGCENTVWLGIYNAVVSLAVPFFFICSGFLLAQKLQYPYSNENSVAIIKGYLVRIIKMYLIWTAVYFPLAVFDYIRKSFTLFDAVKDYFIGLIFVGEHYNSWMLWYLLSTIYALLLILILLKLKVSPKVIVAVGTVLILLSFAIGKLSQYDGDLPLILKAVNRFIPNGRILQGAFYVPIGMLMAQYKIPKIANFVMLIAGFVCNCFFDGIIGLTGLILGVVGLFAIVSEIRVKDISACVYMRKMSTVVYFIHMYVITAYSYARYGDNKRGTDVFIVAVIVSLLISVGYVFIRNKKNSLQAVKN